MEEKQNTRADNVRAMLHAAIDASEDLTDVIISGQTAKGGLRYWASSHTDISTLMYMGQMFAAMLIRIARGEK